MQIDEIKNEGLKREFRVSVGKTDLEARIDRILLDVRDKVHLKGFRPGKAPLSLLRKLHGDAAFGQAVEETVRESTDSLFAERNLRPALRPSVDVGEVDRETGFDFTVSAEILPEIDVSDFKPPELERLVAQPSDAELDKALADLARRSRRFEPAAKTYKAKTGDVVLIDFVGRIDGEAFEGGRGEDVEVELGSGRLLEAFESQLVGVKTGEEPVLSVTFPESYGQPDLAGKTAEFSVTVKEVRRPVDAAVDEELAKSFGLQSLEELKDLMRGRLAEEAAELSRAQVKRALLDALAARYDFEVPESMVELEYKDIWRQIKRDAVLSGEATEEELEDKDEPDSAEERAEFRNIAERRVRLGLLLSEIGLANGIEVSRDELMRRVVEEARKYPGQEKQVYEFYTENEQAMAQLRAPLYEDKVVDFILEMAEVTEREVPLDELKRRIEEEDSAPEESPKATESQTKGRKKGPGKPAKATSSKKTAGKKTTGKKTAAKAPGEKKVAAKKTASRKQAGKAGDGS